MSSPDDRHRLRRQVALATMTLALLAGTIPSLAAGKGYWACSDGNWAAVGHPVYPRPVKACGAQLRVPDDEEHCRTAGGRWGPAGLFPKPVCRVPTHDAGRTCGDGQECEGTCLADLTPAERDRLMRARQLLETLGRCTSLYPVFGCLAVVEKGQVSRVLCRD